MESYIDAHCHIWTPDVARYPLAPGFQAADMKPRSFTAEELLAICRPAGIDRVNLIQMSFYGFDNRYMTDMIKMYPERFVGTAVIDPLAPHPDRAMRELRARGVRAFRLYRRLSKQPAATWLEPPGFASMFAESARSGQALSCLTGPDGFAEIDRMCRAHPGAAVLIDHLGCIGTGGVVRAEDVKSLVALAEHPRVYVKLGGFYALGKKAAPYLDLAPLIRKVVAAFGARRCMWESDSPFQVASHRYDDSLGLIRDRLEFLTAEDKQWLLGRTARQVLVNPTP